MNLGCESRPFNASGCVNKTVCCKVVETEVETEEDKENDVIKVAKREVYKHVSQPMRHDS